MTNEPRMQLSVRESQKDMEILFDFQTDILARKYFLDGKIDRIEHMLTSGDGICRINRIYSKKNRLKGEKVCFHD